MQFPREKSFQNGRKFGRLILGDRCPHFQTPLPLPQPSALRTWVHPHPTNPKAKMYKHILIFTKGGHASIFLVRESQINNFSDILYKGKTYCFAKSNHSLFRSHWNSKKGQNFKVPYGTLPAITTAEGSDIFCRHLSNIRSQDRQK
jgi:hypothetical protein